MKVARGAVPKPLKHCDEPSASGHLFHAKQQYVLT
jgi:hypothetical protein